MERTGASPSKIDKEGRRILKARLKGLGWIYEDSDEEGYDAWTCPPGGERKRAEVESGRKGGWPHIDIRKARRALWSNGSTEDEPPVSGLGSNPTVKVTFDFRALTFDEVFLVRGVGTKELAIYHLTRDEILHHPRTKLRYKGFLNFSLGTAKERQQYRWPRDRV